LRKGPQKLGFIGKKITRKASFNEISKGLFTRACMRTKRTRLARAGHYEEYSNISMRNKNKAGLYKEEND
jgi:hypothetical protein